MLRIRGLLPLIGYSPIQLLSSLPPTSEFCAMSLRTFADPRVFFYRSSTSNFSIGSLLAPMFLTGALHLRLSCAGAAPFVLKGAVFLSCPGAPPLRFHTFPSQNPRFCRLYAVS